MSSDTDDFQQNKWKIIQGLRDICYSKIKFLNETNLPHQRKEMVRVPHVHQPLVFIPSKCIFFTVPVPFRWLGFNRILIVWEPLVI